MAKSKYHFDDYDEEDYEFDKKKEQKSRNRRNHRRLKNALRSKSIDPEQIEEFEDY